MGYLRGSLRRRCLPPGLYLQTGKYGATSRWRASRPQTSRDRQPVVSRKKRSASVRPACVTSPEPRGRFFQRGLFIQSECTLFQPSDCPTNQDHLTGNTQSRFCRAWTSAVCLAGVETMDRRVGHRINRKGIEFAGSEQNKPGLAIVLRPWEYRIQRHRSSARISPAIGSFALQRCGERAILKPAFAKDRSGARPPRPLARRSSASGDVHDPPRQTRYEHSGSTHALPSDGAPR